MYSAIISINWTGQAFSDEQLLVLRNVAAQQLRLGKKRPVVYFKHALCEGTLRRKNEGTFGTFGGTFFHADLGTVKGERWTVDFLLPSGSERIDITADSVVIGTRPLPGGTFESRQVDVKAAQVPDEAHTAKFTETHTVH